jgi:hypothetical protein
MPLDASTPSSGRGELPRPSWANAVANELQLAAWDADRRRRGNHSTKHSHTIASPPCKCHTRDSPKILSPASAVVPLPRIVPFPKLFSQDAIFPTLPSPFARCARHILHHPLPATHATEFQFVWSATAAQHNLDVLRRHHMDHAGALSAQPFSTLSPGLEFRSVDRLAPLLSRHSLWPRFGECIKLGAQFPLRPILNSNRRTALKAALSRGNDKLAPGHKATLRTMMKDKVEKGWQLPLPKEAAL